MPEGFGSAVGRHLLSWSGWVFTVGGAIVSLAVGKEYAWIGWLVLLTGLLALTGHAYSLHRRCQELEGLNSSVAARLREAERKLNEVPLDLVNRIRELVTPQSVTEAAARLAAHADYVLRIRRFATAVAGDIHLRTFVRRDNLLYALAKVEGAALAHLRERDLFVLVRTAEGLRTDCALVVVHQTPDPTHGVVHFRLVELLELLHGGGG